MTTLRLSFLVLVLFLPLRLTPLLLPRLPPPSIVDFSPVPHHKKSPLLVDASLVVVPGTLTLVTELPIRNVIPFCCGLSDSLVRLV